MLLTGELLLLLFAAGLMSCNSKSKSDLAVPSKNFNVEIAQPKPTKSLMDFYVSPSGDDSNDGTRHNPWRTLQKAAEMVKAGATVHVAPGLYAYSRELKTPASGTPTARVRYISEAKWGAKLRSSQTGNSAVWWNQGDYVDIEGFDISGNGALGIYNSGSHDRIIGNLVHDIPAPACPENGGAGIHDGNFSAFDDDIIGNFVHDIGNYGEPCQRVHGIYHTNRGGHIYNNVSFHNQGWGIHLWHAATGVTIADNIVFSNGYGGILIGAESSDFSSGNGEDDNTLVSNNIVFQNGLLSDARGYGILEYGAVGEKNSYINNIVYGNHPANMKVNRKNEWNTMPADPQFINFQPDGSGNYRLRPESPACSQGWRHPAC